jgi:hypothetical protein
MGRTNSLPLALERGRPVSGKAVEEDERDQEYHADDDT